MDDDPLQLRGLSLVVAAAFAALAFSKFPDAVAAIGTAAVAGFLPLVFLAPLSWSGRMARDRATREAIILTSGFAVYAIAAAADPKAASAVVMGSASLYLVIAGRLPWRRSRVRGRRLLAAAAGCAIAGMLADLPGVVAWHTVAFAAFGISASWALDAAVASAVEPGEQATTTR